MKVIFRFISRLGTDEERICELEDVSVDTSKTKRQRERKPGKNSQKKTPKNCGTTTKNITCT